MKRIRRKNMFAALGGSILLGFTIPGMAESPSPLDAAQHPASPQYESLFSERILPLDTRVSWKNRFSGNESFNAEESLPETSKLVGKLATDEDRRRASGAGAGAYDATGIVRQVKPADGKIKIEHGPIDRLGMPGMTMVFRVEDPGQLSGLEKGAEIDFDVDNTAAGFAITRIRMKADTSTASFDTRGTIKSVRADQGKVKIEHGPIDRLGMPGMTMVFRVEDPAMLAGLEKGAEIDFDVENSAAGFAITRIGGQATASGASFDARGRVKSVRAEQGKVRVEHGPIDRLGMPGMTMVFKLRNASDLDLLARDMEIDFDVENGPGGFEITRVRPVSGAASETDSTMAAAHRACFSVGPFDRRAKALEVASRYRDRGATIEFGSRVERRYVGEMIYIDGLETRSDALAAAKKLAANGVGDSLVLNEAGKRNALSLGVFGLRQNAERVRAQAESLQYDVKSEARYRQRNVVWLHGVQVGAQAVPDLLAAAETQAGISHKPGACTAKEAS